MQRLMIGLATLLSLGWIPEAATAGMILDNFDDGNADGWVFPFNSGLTQFPGGSWAVENGTLVQHFFGDDNAGLLNNVLVGNQTIESKVSTSGYAGIVLWYQQMDSTWANFVSVEYSVQGGLFVREAIDGILSRYSYGGPFIGSEVWFELKVEAASASGDLTVYLNETQLFTHVATTTYRTGLSGVFSGNELASFDDFQITSDEIVPEPSSLALWGSLGLMTLVASRPRLGGCGLRSKPRLAPRITSPPPTTPPECCVHPWVAVGRGANHG